MLRISMTEAREGMVLARTIPNPQQPELALLKAGFVLDNDTITRLRQFKVSGAWIRYPSLDFLDKVIDPDIIKKQQDLYGLLKSQFQEGQEFNISKLPYRQYLESIRDIFQHLLNQRHPTSNFISDLYCNSHDVFMHGTLVASLALLLSLRVDAYIIKKREPLPVHLASDVSFLGLGCLLHDIGKLQLPEELRSFHLSAQDMGTGQWQSHTEVGFEMMKAGLDSTAGQIIINHHQHYDGSGFPNRRAKPGQTAATIALNGENIHIFCRIAALVDRFDGFRYMPDGSLAPTVVALKRLRKPGYAKWFDPYLYETFLAMTPPFALGEQVTLNNGQNVAVVELNEDEPCRPVVRPIDVEAAANPESLVKEMPDIDLSLQTNLSIAKVGDFDVTAFLH